MSKAGSKKYPHHFKVQALLLLQHNGFNQLQTAKEIGVSIKTLAKWKDLYGAEAFKTEDLSNEDRLLLPDQRTKEIKTLRKNMLKNEEYFLEKVYHTRDLAIEKGKELLLVETDLKKVTDFMRIAHEIITGDHIKSLEERKNSISFFTQINNKFINNEEPEEQ